MLSRVLVGVLFAISLSHSVKAADIAEGKQLVDAHCYKCHGTEVYTRPDRRVTDLAKLHSQVRRCELSLGLKWFDDDIENTASFLDKEFYKFE